MSVVLSQHRWPSLAQDLAVMTVPGSPLTELDQVCATYGISEKELKEVLTIPAFQALFKTALDGFKSQGNAAGARYRAGTLSQALSEKLFRDASRGDMDAKDAIKFLEILLKTAGLYDSKETTVATQVNVGVNLPLPRSLSGGKLKHAFPAEVLDVSV